MEQGVLWAQEMECSHVIFEADALSVIQAINDNNTGSDYGHIARKFSLPVPLLLVVASIIWKWTTTRWLTS